MKVPISEDSVSSARSLTAAVSKSELVPFINTVWSRIFLLSFLNSIFPL